MILNRQNIVDCEHDHLLSIPVSISDFELIEESLLGWRGENFPTRNVRIGKARPAVLDPPKAIFLTRMSRYEPSLLIYLQRN